jgi:hypothetical protein
MMVHQPLERGSLHARSDDIGFSPVQRVAQYRERRLERMGQMAHMCSCALDRCAVADDQRRRPSGFPPRRRHQWRRHASRPLNEGDPVMTPDVAMRPNGAVTVAIH